MTVFEFVTILVSGLSATASACAVIVAVRNSNAQARLSLRVHEDQMMLSQRQLFLEIWPKLVSISDIDVKDPIAAQVVNAVNVLELVALCWEGGMVDSGVILRSFGDVFVRLYEDISRVEKLANPAKSGMDMIRENPAIGRLYEQLRAGALGRNALTPIGAPAKLGL